MKPSPLPFGIGRGLEPGERRTIALGTMAVVAAVVLTQLVFPFARRWTEREQRIAATRALLSRLSQISGREGEIDARARARESELSAGGPRVLHARSPALAASALQALLREQARVSGIAISRLDVAGTVDAVGAPAVPATLSAVGDIYGLGRFLQLLQHGRTLLDVREVNVANTSAIRPGLLQLAITVHAPFVSGE